MKLSPDLAWATPKAWTNAVLNDFNSFLQDHADCERKASAMAMSFVAKCPDKLKIIPRLIDTALEELEHFKSVYSIMIERGVTLKAEMPQDQYVQQLIARCRTPKDQRLIDRMLIASIIECRGAERFRMLSDALEDLSLKKFYKMLWTSEAKHGNIFIEMALDCFPEKEINKRVIELVDAEAEICSRLPFRAAMH